jgi:4-oxalocrotonate tautomerase family enzyme
MPHIAIKMLKGRTEEQKKKAAEAVSEALRISLGVPQAYISVSVEDYTAAEWQKVFRDEVTGKSSDLYVKPDYDPKSLL